MATIVQEYGPIYGEAVNGTVSGRPNGSYYIPTDNLISLSIPDESKYLGNYTSGRIRVVDSSGVYHSNWVKILAVAEAQDLASSIQFQIFEDSDCTDLLAYRDWTAGIFNASCATLYLTEGSSLVDGTTYYVRAQLMNNGVAVATSDVIEVTGVVPA